MDLSRYFATNDGSLPEIEIAFSDAASLHLAFARLFELGGELVRAHPVWLRKEQREIPFSGPQDAMRVTDGAAEPFHLVLRSIRVNGQVLPDLGVLVDTMSLVLDYRMGPAWTCASIGALLDLLASVRTLGGEVSVTNWWGDAAQEAFARQLDGRTAVR